MKGQENSKPALLIIHHRNIRVLTYQFIKTLQGNQPINEREVKYLKKDFSPVAELAKSKNRNVKRMHTTSTSYLIKYDVCCTKSFYEPRRINRYLFYFEIALHFFLGFRKMHL